VRKNSKKKKEIHHSLTDNKILFKNQKLIIQKQYGTILTFANNKVIV
jgi:5-bromo-4-chloroindolyl phosphate hydrolysis protein